MHRSLTRSQLLASLAAAGAAFVLPAGRPEAAQAPEHFTVTHTDAQWRALLTPGQYDVLRRRGTEPPGSSPLETEHRKGTYACAGCELALFSSETKFDSGTGWPSFYQPLPHAVDTETDYSMVIPRTEVHCSRCGGHLGHVFDDGPPPTGERYCMNGIAMKFTPTDTK